MITQESLLVRKQLARWANACIARVMLFLFLVTSNFLFAQQENRKDANPAIPTVIRKQLEEHASAMRLVYLEYTETQSGDNIPSSYGGPTAYVAYIATNQFYVQSSYLYPSERGARTIHEDAFDGKFFYLGDPYDPVSNPVAVLQKYSPYDETDPNQSLPICFRYLESTGFLTPECISDLASFRAVESSVIHYLNYNNSTTIEKLDNHYHVTVKFADPLLLRARNIDLEQERKKWAGGPNSPQSIAKRLDSLKKMQSMEPTRTAEFVLDPEHGYAVVQRKDFNSLGQLIVHREMDQWKYYESKSIWLPHRCTKSYHTDRFTLQDFSEKPRLAIVLKLNKCEFGDKPNCAFALDYRRAGTVVIERTTPEAQSRPDHAVNYTISANGSLLKDSAKSALREIKSTQFLIWFIAINSAICGMFLIGKFRSPKTTNSK